MEGKIPWKKRNWCWNKKLSYQHNGFLWYQVEGKEEIKQCLISGQKYFEIGKFPIKKTSLKNKNKN